MARQLAPFKLERFFAKHEFAAPHLACCSDCEPMTLQELLAGADEDSLARWSALRLSYTESQGLPALREAVSSLYQRVSPEQLVVCVPEEGVYLTMRALLRAGDTVVASYPGYQSLTEVAAACGCTVEHWEPAASPSGRLRFDLQDAKRLIRPGVKLVVANFPHNPTGLTLSHGDYEALVGLSRDAGAWLFSDEMYRFTELPPAQPLPSAADLYDKAIALCGLSKSWGLPGLRLGWVACRDAELLQSVLALKDYTTICSPGPSEVLALAAVRATPRLTERCRSIILANLAAAEAFFSRWPSVLEWHAPMAGPIAFPRIKTGEPIEAWCERLVAEAGVLLLPATVYDHAPTTEAGHFRLGLGRRDLPACLEHWETWMHQRYGAGGGGEAGAPRAG